MDKRAKGTDAGALRMVLARAYVPFQVYNTLFPVEEFLVRGTVFPELYRPYRPGMCCS